MRKVNRRTMLAAAAVLPLSASPVTSATAQVADPDAALLALVERHAAVRAELKAHYAGAYELAERKFEELLPEPPTALIVRGRDIMESCAPAQLMGRPLAGLQHLPRLRQARRWLQKSFRNYPTAGSALPVAEREADRLSNLAYGLETQIEPIPARTQAGLKAKAALALDNLKRDGICAPEMVVALLEQIGEMA